MWRTVEGVLTVKSGQMEVSPSLALLWLMNSRISSVMDRVGGGHSEVSSSTSSSSWAEDEWWYSVYLIFCQCHSLSIYWLSSQKKIPPPPGSVEVARWAQAPTQWLRMRACCCCQLSPNCWPGTAPPHCLPAARTVFAGWVDRMGSQTQTKPQSAACVHTIGNYLTIFMINPSADNSFSVGFVQNSFPKP